MEAGVAARHGWRFKAKLRAHAYGWRGSALTVTRLKEAVSEIKAIAKSDPVTAGEGAVLLMERIWPAFQDIDTSSGALGTAIVRTLERPCCMDQQEGRIHPYPVLGSCDADGLRASKLQHAVQRMDGNLHLGRPALIRAAA